ncbi:MAG: N-6 DNA methylase, partial [Coriobacteriia bacterium]|nr:N-6 DNA methylase [Coriobacteriia bacterium]
AFKALRDNLKRAGRLNGETELVLRQQVFWGFDNDERSVTRTKLNMFLVGDGHMNVHERDTIVDWGDGDWCEGAFQYILTNPPMGKYEGDEDISSFEFTNERRMELLFTERVIRATEPGGGIAIVLNDGALEAPSRQQYRQKLLEYCDVRAVVSLTKFAFAPYTKEKTYVVFMRRKQKADEGVRQGHPIWHYIVDYDGFANSDKRFRTKYHDDLPELTEFYAGAMRLLDEWASIPDQFEARRGEYEREVHDQERSEGLWGAKCAFVPIGAVADSNFDNLLSEFHLRPHEAVPMSLSDVEASIANLRGLMRELAGRELE